MNDKELSLDYILDNIMYEIVFNNGVTLMGDLSYVSSHYQDGTIVSTGFSEYQPAKLQKFYDELFKYNKENNITMTIENFYHSIWIKEKQE